MSSYAQTQLIDGFIDTVADIVCSQGLHNVKEIGVFQDIPPPPDERTIPKAIREENGHLGLAQWSLNALYIAGKKRLHSDPSDFRAASAMLLACPDFTTAWNVRKRRLVEPHVPDELHFNRLLLTRNPKSAETWAHRAWVLRKFEASSPRPDAELEIAWVAASRATSNYYAGVHRSQIVSKVAVTLLRAEHEQSLKWLRTHLSDSSGWWYHRQLVSLIRQSSPDVIDAELSFLSSVYETHLVANQCLQVQKKWLQKVQQATSTNAS